MSTKGLKPVVWADLDPRQRDGLLLRPALADSAKVESASRAIIEQVRNGGDAALARLTAELDGIALCSIEVCKDEIDAAERAIPSSLRRSLQVASDNIEAFHEAQRSGPVQLETAPGVRCERISHPLDAVGFYIPGGSAPLPSTVLMLGVPARLAGCPVRVMCTPPGADGHVNPTVLAAARLAGVQRVFAVGGAQAIAAMAYGTESVPRATKIFGPGNQYVTAAKSLVSQDPAGAACDLPAGPSELLVIADDSADAESVAADLLSQAEHGGDSQVLLLTDSLRLAHAVAQELPLQAVALPRYQIVAHSLASAALIVTTDLSQAVSISNEYAPEHLIINTRKPRALLAQVRNAGSVFLGPYAPESVGDYCSGTNHVLPTYGWARSHSGVGMADFLRTMTVQELSAEGLAGIGPHTVRLAQIEGLDAHANAVTLRLDRIRPGAVA